MHWVRFFVACLLLAACSGSSNPATTPALVPTTSTTTTTTLAPTTTLDRLAEIEAIVQDLEQRRLDALYSGDVPGFRALHVDNGYLEENMEAFELAEFEVPPVVDVEVLRLIHDGPECIAIEERGHRPDLDATSRPVTVVLELLEGVWLISYVGSGWECDGPHPFDT